jgi:hypothetical protein
MRKKRLFYWVVLTAILGIAFIGFRAASAAEEELDPLIVCKDTQKLVFENQLVRVVEERVPPGVAQAKHRHRHGVSIALSDYTNEETSYPSHKTMRRSRKAGDAGWREASVHESRNVGTTEEHVMRIELKY